MELPVRVPTSSLRHRTETLARQRDIGNPGGESATLDSLGYVHHQLGDYRQALDCYEQALALRTQLGRRCYETATLDRIGDTRMAMGETDAARQAWLRAPHIFTGPRHHHAAPVDAKLGALGG